MQLRAKGPIMLGTAKEVARGRRFCAGEAHDREKDNSRRRRFHEQDSKPPWMYRRDAD